MNTLSIKNMQLKKCLMFSSAFVGFTQDDIDTLVQSMSVEQYPDGYVFINEGERGDALYILIEGSVLITRQTYNSRNVEFIEHLQSGALFGLISLIDKGKRTATCQAAGRVTVASLPISAFVLLSNSNLKLTHRFQCLIAWQLSRDTRVYNKALREIVLRGREDNFYGILRTASYEYRGPERRVEERRVFRERRKVSA